MITKLIIKVYSLEALLLLRDDFEWFKCIVNLRFEKKNKRGKVQLQFNFISYFVIALSNTFHFNKIKY